MSAAVALSIVIPAYLEEENLRLLLPRLRVVLEGLAISAQVLVVDTLTPLDTTREVCSEQGFLAVGRRGSNAFGDAIRTGIAESLGEWVLFMDADGSHPPEFIPELWRWRHGADIVAASRYIPGGATENPRLLILLSWILNIVYRWTLRLSCFDVSNSFKLYRGSILRRLDLRCVNFDIVEEMLVRYVLELPGARIHEVPFVFKSRLFGRTKRKLLPFAISFLATLARLLVVRFNGIARGRARQPGAGTRSKAG